MTLSDLPVHTPGRPRRGRHAAALAFCAGVAVAVVMAMGVAGPAAAAGFDCARAVKAAEHAICQDPDLSRSDRHQATLYAALLQSVAPALRDNLRASQRQFLRERDGCQSNLPCLQSAYLWRFHELCGMSKLHGLACSDPGAVPR